MSDPVAPEGARARSGGRPRGHRRAMPPGLAACAAAVPLLAPSLAQACVECRQRVLDAVFGDGFLATMASLMLPLPLVLAAAVALGRGWPRRGQPDRDRSERGRSELGRPERGHPEHDR